MPIARDFKPTLTGMHVLLSGNIVDGITIYGPFKTGEDAIQYGNQRGDRLGDDSWCIAPLAAPDQWLVDRAVAAEQPMSDEEKADQAWQSRTAG